ncbi:MAG: 2'-5' RNA ligase family protein [Pseudomonadota bacterium]|nr:2'-5' RNA ligase family protein [Pseudomonadota bacterium]
MRAFVGIPLDGPEAEALLDVQGRIAVGREVPAANLHLTLSFLDDQPVEMLEASHEELELIRQSQFELHLKGMDILARRAAAPLGCWRRLIRF